MRVCWRCGTKIKPKASLCAPCKELPPIKFSPGNQYTMFGSPLTGNIMQGDK